MASRDHVTMLRNTGAGQFAAGDRIETSWTMNIDLDGDVDLVTSDRTVSVWRNARDGRFSGPESYELTAGNPGICWTHAIAAFDLNREGYPDIATADSSISRIGPPRVPPRGAPRRSIWSDASGITSRGMSS